MKVYFDVCCLNRPFDDQAQARIRLEAEAVLLILTRLQENEWDWIGSEAVEDEIDQIPDPERRSRIQRLLSYTHQHVFVGSEEKKRATQLAEMGFSAYDALHLACAESSGSDIFLTTDDRLLKRAIRLANRLNVRVANPLSWLEKVTKP